MIRVRQIVEGGADKIHTLGRYNDDIKKIEVDEYCVFVTLKCGQVLVCTHLDYDLDELEEGQQLGELL